jgi:putative redox protein
MALLPEHMNGYRSDKTSYNMAIQTLPGILQSWFVDNSISKEFCMSMVTVKWIEGTFMVGVDSRGNSVTLSWSKERDPQWSGMKPSDLLLISVASCSGYDVASILQKQRQPLVDLEIQCGGEQLADPPYRFASIHLKYILKGDLDPKKVTRAIKLSEDKFCSVLNTLRPGVELSSEFEILPG